MNRRDPDRTTLSTKQSIAYRQGIADAQALNSRRSIRPPNYATAEERESYGFGRDHGGNPVKPGRRP